MPEIAEMNFTFKVGDDDELLVDCDYNIPRELDIDMDEILDAVAMTLVALYEEEHGEEVEIH